MENENRPGQAHGLQVLYEDNHLIALNKTGNDLIQGDKTGDTPLSEKVKTYLKAKYDKPGKAFLGVVHRLDRPTSGVVVFARTSKALGRMNRLFQQKGEVKKIYWAVVDNPPEPPAGEWDDYLRKNQEKNKSFVVAPDKAGAKLASLRYRLLDSSERYHLIEIELLTGRHHQIRAQLAQRNIRIRGDLKYGFPRSNPDGGIHLHARSLAFAHPVRNEPVQILAPPPSCSLWDYFYKRNAAQHT